jgi:uncharacterized protein
MRVFLDTNVIISAVTTRGMCADVFRAVLADHELVTCSEVLHEVERILHVKFLVPENLIPEYLELLKQDTIVAVSKDPPNIQIKDEDDLPILNAAIDGKADILVTGDSELQGIRSIGNVRILSPRSFWNELTDRPDGLGAISAKLDCGRSLHGTRRGTGAH